MPAHASPDPARRATALAAAPRLDLTAEDLAGLALDLSPGRDALGVLRSAADGVARLVPAATQVVVSTLGRDGVELSAATGSGAASLEAWQHAVRNGPAARAAEQPGVAVVVDDLGHDPRWPDLHTVARREGLLSVLSVAAVLPVHLPVSSTGNPPPGPYETPGSVVVGCYSTGRGALDSPDAVRATLLAVAHVAAVVAAVSAAGEPGRARTDDEHPAGHGRDVPRSR